MKKVSIERLRRKKRLATPSRITNETVAEHREQILAGGRKFKYPVQYARHKLVINAVAISVGSILILLVLGWQQLYIAQNASSFMYRVTRLLPLPVASVNGEQVNYSDYLVNYRGSEFYLSKYDEIKLNSDDGKRQLDHIKRESMDKAVANAYARQLARSKKVKITSKDIDAVVDQQRNTVNGQISQETYDASSMMMYGWSRQDYRSAVEQSLLRARVAFAVDDKATAQKDLAVGLVKETNGDFAKVAERLATMPGAKPAVGQTGMISTAGSYQGLPLSEIAKLGNGQVSGVLQSTTDDGYFFVKPVNKSDTQVDFTFLHIPLTEFNGRLAQLYKDKKVHEYISIPDKHT